jgi:hypothetical protein
MATSPVSEFLQHLRRAGAPAPVVSSTIQAASLFAAGQAAATGAMPAPVALAEGVLKAMLLTRLKIATAVLVVVAAVSSAAGLIYRAQAAGPPGTAPVTGNKAGAKAEAGGATEKGAENGEGKGPKKEVKEGTLLADLEKLDPKEGSITVTRQGVLLGGLGDQRGGIGVFTKDIRLENLPVARTARILVNGKEAKLADLKPGMPVSLQLAVKGGITVQAITAESK